MKFRISNCIEIASVSDSIKKSRCPAWLMTLLCIFLLCSCGVENTPKSNSVDHLVKSSLNNDPIGVGTKLETRSLIQPKKRSDLCVNCHEDHCDLWLEGGHRLISCVRCHGFVTEHTLEEIDPRPKMELHGDAVLCMSCHDKNKNNSVTKAPKIEGFEKHVTLISKKHSVRIDLKKMKNQCIFCHDPHSLE